MITVPASESKKRKFNFFNTCGFDSLIAAFCVIACDCVDDDIFKWKNDNEDLLFLISLLNTVGYTSVNGRAQKLKEKILAEMMMVNSNNKFQITDCQNNITFFLEKILKKTGSYSIIKNCCCNQLIVKIIPFIYFNVSSEIDFLDKLNQIDKLVESKKNKCVNDHFFDVKYKFEEIIYIQVIFFKDVNPIELKKIHLNITLDNKVYNCKAIINYKPPHVENGLGHYQCYARREKNWQVYDNSTKTVIKPDRHVIPHLIVYTRINKKY